MPLEIAIIGGGLAGSTLATALLQHAHLHISIFESAPEFSERGAAVGIATNGQTALREMGKVLGGVIERAGGVVMGSSRICLASGPNAMDVLVDLAGEQRGRVMHRAALLAELLRPIDEEKKFTNKKVTKIDDDINDNGKVTIHFDDNTTFHADAVIGADGVRGYVRRHILGPDHPALNARPAGFWDCRALMPFAKAKEILGEEYFEVDRQYGWIGNGGFFMHDVLDGGETVQCVLCQVEKWGEDEWTRPLDQAGPEKVVEKWSDTPLKGRIVQAMLQNPDLKAYAQTHHSIDAPTYSKNRVCIMGDSAHASTPWQGSGAGQAIEDAMILETLFAEVEDASQVPAVFQAYDRVRRPRTQRIVHSSHATGLILSGVGEGGEGVDPEKIKNALPQRWGFIHGMDLKAHKREALEVFRKLLSEG
ncbi:salicylate hydroxylase [Paraphoma chrysanthemicola]|nr:salicylate hydroxylase [Paraphoma chrysanthemicola]